MVDMLSPKKADTKKEDTKKVEQKVQKGATPAAGAVQKGPVNKSGAKAKDTKQEAVQTAKLEVAGEINAAIDTGDDEVCTSVWNCFWPLVCITIGYCYKQVARALAILQEFFPVTNDHKYHQKKATILPPK